MKPLSLYPLLAALLLSASFQTACDSRKDGPVGLIIETDMGNDIDDAIALALAHKGMDEGMVDLLMVSNHKASEKDCPSAFIDMMNTYYAHPEVAVARCATPVVNKDRDYTAPVVEMDYPRCGRYTGGYPEAVAEYRRILSGRPNHSVVIVSLGFAPALAQLLESGPDSYSRLSGRDLVKKKVKYLSIMAGSYGPDDTIPINGARATYFDGFKKRAEYNVRKDIPSMQKVFDRWPTPIYQNPFELGTEVMYPGKAIWKRTGNPMFDAYRSYKPQCYDRPSWDILSVAFVFRPDLFQVSDPVTVTVDDEGYTHVKSGGSHRILILTEEQKALLKEYETDETKGQSPKPFTAAAEVFNPEGSHIQGIAASEEALYISQDRHLAKVDWTGKLLKSREVPNHTGDLCWYEGELYAALALSGTSDSPLADPSAGIGKIQVFDKDLKLVRETEIDRRTDGITCLDGVLYVGMGSKTQPSKNPHRVNILGRFDAKTLKEIAPRAEFDYGYETKYSFQNITTDGKELYGSFYSVDGAPQIVVFDKDLNVLRTYFLKANQGLDVMPPKLTGGQLLFIKAKSHKASDPKSVSCSFDYWAPED